MQRTVGYLARYACRVAISNEWLISMEDGHVSFHYKDYRDNHGRGPMKVLDIAGDFTERPVTSFLPIGAFLVSGGF
jgi:hypothetical protein